jgi:hypothetical protein
MAKTAKTDWGILKNQKRKEAVKRMKAQGVAYEEADRAFLEMMIGKKATENFIRKHGKKQ